jgi:CBS domain-containing protein
MIQQLLVRDLMTVGVPTCSPDTPIRELARLFLERGVDTLVVLEEGHALGIVSLDELITAYIQHPPADPASPPSELSALTARQLMHEGVPQVPPDIPLAAAAQLMRDQGVQALFVIHHASGIEYPAAMITHWHLLRHLAAEEKDDLSDLGIQAARQAPLAAFFQRRDAARRRNIP